MHPLLRHVAERPKQLVKRLRSREREASAPRLHGPEARWRALFDSMQHGFCVIDVLFDDAGRAFDYRFVDVNPAFEKHTGLADAVGRTMRELVPALEPFWFEVYGRVATTGTPTHFVHHAQALGRWYDVDASRLDDAPRGRVAVLFTDISERVRVNAEREALAARLHEQDARKDEFLATLAHELRSPLTPLRNGLRLLDRARDDKQAWDKAHAMMDRQVGLLVRLVDDLLDTARITCGKIELQRAPVLLADVMQRAIEVSQPLIDLGGHELVLELPHEPIVLDVDEIRVAQVLSNLLNNAAKYSERGGRIVLRAALATRADGSQVADVRVRDQGVGIAPAMVSRVFDLYTQVDASLAKAQGGLGIGLTLARNLVELHGGTISAYSDGLGHGSEFVVTLPVSGNTAPPCLPQHVTATAVQPMATTRRRVLIADDNADAADSLAALLRIHGHDSRAVYDARSAIEQCEAYRPDLALLDLGMPGASGLDACRRMRALEWVRRARIVAVTGWSDERTRARCHDAGFDAWMVKPLDDAVLQRMLTESAAR